MVPGEPEGRTYQERSTNGIPLPQGTVANLRSIASRFEVALPQGL
jgi:LDH2 family malate/lactate/ureidoglycolate dehydrogenase